MILGVDWFPPFEMAYEQRQPGFWVADVDIPALHLQLEEIYLRAKTTDEVEYKLQRYVQGFVYRLRHPSIPMLN